MTAVHQFVPNLAPRDAVGGHVLEVRRTLRDAGYASDIYVGNVVPELRGETRRFEAYDSGVQAGTWLLYQASTGHPMAEFVGDRPEPKLVDYHNVTPPSFFAGWEPRVAAELSAGLRQMEALAPRTTM